MSETEPPPPIVDPDSLRPVVDGVWILADRRVPLVPNIGIIVGSRGALIFDTGMGNANGRTTLDAARRLAGSKPLFLTVSYFHPEHGYGAGVFKS